MVKSRGIAASHHAISRDRKSERGVSAEKLQQLGGMLGLGFAVFRNYVEAEIVSGLCTQSCVSLESSRHLQVIPHEGRRQQGSRAAGQQRKHGGRQCCCRVRQWSVSGSYSAHGDRYRAGDWREGERSGPGPDKGLRVSAPPETGRERHTGSHCGLVSDWTGGQPMAPNASFEGGYLNTETTMSQTRQGAAN